MEETRYKGSELFEKYVKDIKNPIRICLKKLMGFLNKKIEKPEPVYLYILQ